MLRKWIALSLAGLMLITLFGCATPAGRSAGQVIDDSAITTKVKALILEDSFMKGLAISVTTFNGKVTLTGGVETAAQKRKHAEVDLRIQHVDQVMAGPCTPDQCLRLGDSAVELIKRAQPQAYEKVPQDDVDDFCILAGRPSQDIDIFMRRPDTLYRIADLVVSAVLPHPGEPLPEKQYFLMCFHRDYLSVFPATILMLPGNK